jgi:hypothetical protein
MPLLNVQMSYQLHQLRTDRAINIVYAEQNARDRTWLGVGG